MGNFNDRVPHATYTNPSNMQLYDVIKHVWRDAEPGDMIQYHRIDYEHWGIYIGNDKVIQATVRDFGNTFMDKFMSAMVTIITFGRQTAFAKITEESFHNVLQSDGVARINNFKDEQWEVLPENKIVERARKCVNIYPYPYHVLCNNCEHFVTWCRYGRGLSGQEEAFWSTITFGIYKRNDVVVVSTLGDTVDSNPPKGPLSDVTSIITPTENGGLCKLPYRVNPYSWDMHFCNEDYCETATNPKSKCASGRFGHVQLFNTNVYSIPLNAGTGGINGINEQCIIYYYYIPDSVDIQMSITLRKVENDSTTEIIDSVTNSPFNGWTQQKIDFQARQSEYMIYFDFQKTIGILPSFGIDEISIHQGLCSDAYITQSTTNEVSTSTVSIPTTESETSKAITMESSTITTNTSTIISEETITSVISSTQMDTGQFTSSTSTMITTRATSTMIITRATTSTMITTQATSTMLATTVMPGTIFTVKNSSTTTMETTSTNKITENIELTSIRNLSHMTSTVTDQQPMSNSQTLIIILGTTIPIGISGVILLITWLKSSFCSKRSKSNIHEMNQVAPTPI
ncbi:unnamed protein product [Rotaria socialis]